MLVLSRCVGESVVVGEGVRITLAECSGGRVKLRIEAPPDVMIRRGELVYRDAKTDGQTPAAG